MGVLMAEQIKAGDVLFIGVPPGVEPGKLSELGLAYEAVIAHELGVNVRVLCLPGAPQVLTVLRAPELEPWAPVDEEEMIEVVDKTLRAMWRGKTAQDYREVAEAIMRVLRWR